ncbi:hypothetical protein OCHUTO_0755 [Orientia chuto str. Dubai]|uniref:Uncharacterized protein n=1 Tax=Orientia chuto str. Dubai TaxID=1359168 RepID=A0A0F3MJL7_9RICK|nr:hypothetical protein [Candidatus Orientia mediorientalis]KJV55647.1 hypothetical protein OCHUTO_0755 [Orientia chuto str. Dubai]
MIIKHNIKEVIGDNYRIQTVLSISYGGRKIFFGKAIFDKEQKNKAILIFPFKQNEDTKHHIRMHGLNRYRHQKNDAAMLKALMRLKR